MNMLQRMSLKGFKSIRELRDLEFKPLNVLVGANGAGKSNLISFFRLLNFAMTDALRTYVGEAGYARSLLHQGDAPEVSTQLQFRTANGSNGYEATLKAAAGGALIFTEEAVVWHRDGSPVPRRTLLGIGGEKSLLNDPIRQQDSTVRVVRHLLMSTRVYQFHDTSATSRLRSKWQLDDNRYLFDHGGNLASVLYYLRERKRDTYNLIVSTVQQAVPFFGDFALAPDRLNPSVIDLRWREQGSSYELGPHQLSDGTLRFIALVTLLSQPADDLPGIVIVDEPELGLHPSALSVLADLLRSASASSQVIVSTQSVTLVNRMAPEDIVVVDREGGQSMFRRLDEAALAGWLEDYAMGELWEKNVLGGRP